MATQPKIIDKWLHVAQDGYAAVERRYIGRFGMTPKIIVVHIQEGNNLGSWQWFHVTTASSTVEIAKNGDIWRLVPEGDAPWTNGDVNNPSAIGREIINKWGPDPNVYTLSIENEGYSSNTHTAAAWAAYRSSVKAQVDSNVWQIKQWMSKYRIEAIYVIRHKDISQNGKPTCPGDAFFNELKQAISNLITTPATDAEPVYAKPSPVPNFDGTKDVIVNGITFHADPKTVTATSNEAFVRQYATSLSSSTREPLYKGEKFGVHGWVKGESVKGEDRWWVTSYSHSRVWVGDTIEKPTEDAPADALPDQLPSEIRIVDGVTYYPTYEPTTTNPHAKREFKIRVDSAVIRNKATTKGEVVRKVVKGDKLIARYWCFGEEVKGDRIWWLLDNNTSDPFSNPQFIWAASSEERPD